MVRIAIYEDNLMWSARLQNSVRALGHEGIVITTPDIDLTADCAIINLGSTTLGVALVPALKQNGTTVIAHAGHKEKDLHSLGADAGCDVLATNSELTHKLPQILESVEGRRKSG